MSAITVYNRTNRNSALAAATAGAALACAFGMLVAASAHLIALAVILLAVAIASTVFMIRAQRREQADFIAWARANYGITFTAGEVQQLRKRDGAVRRNGDVWLLTFDPHQNGTVLEHTVPAVRG